MSGCTLLLREPPPVPLDLAPVRPEAVLGRSARAIGALPLRLGNRTVALGELFTVRTGTPAAEELVLEGTSRLCDRIGAELATGTIRVVGDAGVELGLGMTGGRIEVEGSAGDLAAAEAKGGVVHIRGHTGARLAGALPGSGGVRGATVIVEGLCGPSPATAMRRGLVILLGGCAGEAAMGLRGGTVILCGPCGPRPGAAMRRGSLLLLDAAFDPGPSFLDTGTHELLWLAVLARELAGLGLSELIPGRRARRFVGDRAELGKGELLLFA